MPVKKLLISLLLSLLGVSIFSNIAIAQERQKATVSVVFVNNAKASYDDELTKKITGWLYGKVNGIYNVVPNNQYIMRLNKAGLNDLSQIEKKDIIDAYSDSSVDYVIFAELEPFIRKERLTVFTYGKDMTANMILKIIDVPNEKFIYNGKFNIKGSDTTGEWLIGDKSVAIKAIDSVLVEAGEIISFRLPLDPPKRHKIEINLNANP